MRGGLAPRTSDLVLSIALHALVIGLVVLRTSPGPTPQLPRVYRVDLVRPERIPPAPAPRQRPKEAIQPPKETQARPRHRPEARPLPRQDEPKREERVEEKREVQTVEPVPRNTSTAAQVAGPVRLEGDMRVADPYLQQIVARINRGWQTTRGSGQARCVIYFRIVRSGKVEGVRIEKASGSVVFDRAALSAVKRVGRFLPLPPSVRDRYLGVHFEFVREG
ncbi:MAG: hypothetical protein CME06_14925 [Gemmatimonadetes bacterium]|nr:hypothetical protein [Gemmatimonadota bacterium]